MQDAMLFIVYHYSEEMCIRDSPKGIHEDLERKDMQEAVDQILKTLTDREQKVIRARFGFDNGEEKTLEEVGLSLIHILSF